VASGSTAPGKLPAVPGMAGPGEGLGGQLPDKPLLPAKSRYARYEPVVIGTGAVVLLLVIWQLAAEASLVSSLVLPSPTSIASALVAYVKSSTFGIDLATSGQEVLYGYLLSVVVGVPLGLAMGWYRRLDYALDPFVSFAYASPRIAIAPLVVIWFGIGIWSKVAIIFVMSVFSILINTRAGVKNLDAHLIKAARSFGAGDWQMFRTVALPGALPFIITGLRLGVGQALIGVVVGELIAAQHGIGQAMATFGTTFQTASVFATLIIVAGAGLLLQQLFQRFERRFSGWRPQ
jgi:ABC-type nitrate/sulfonate/bicarbonate transport system permease component